MSTTDATPNPETMKLDPSPWGKIKPLKLEPGDMVMLYGKPYVWLSIGVFSPTTLEEER